MEGEKKKEQVVEGGNGNFLSESPRVGEAVETRSRRPRQMRKCTHERRSLALSPSRSLLRRSPTNSSPSLPSPAYSLQPSQLSGHLIASNSDPLPELASLFQINPVGLLFFS